MIIRVFEGVVDSPHEAEFVAYLRDDALPNLRRARGLVYAQLGRQVVADGQRVVLISEWRTPADLYAWAGPDLQNPRLVSAHMGWLREYEIRHYEALDVERLLDTGELVPEVEPAGGQPADEEPRRA